MTPLPTSFSKNGSDYWLFERDGDVALLEKTTATTRVFDVVIVQRWSDRRVAGRLIPAGEALPSPRQWGVLGWTCKTIDAALSKFEAVAAQQRTKAARAAMEAEK